MATTSSTIAELYSDIVADLIPYYDNYVLLPNPALILNTFDITGSSGNAIKIPLTNSWTAGITVGEGNAIISGNAVKDFDPTSVTLSVSKRGAGSFVTEESLEDGGYAVVRQALLTRLSRAIAQATDVAGFNFMVSGAEAALTDISGISGVTNDGLANTALTTADLAVVFSPEAMAYGIKRNPVLKMFNDVDKDQYEMVATVRNGFARPRPGFIRVIAASNAINEATANLRCSLSMVSTSVANLRKVNAPTDASGFYMVALSAAHEYHLAAELNGVGGLSTGAIGDLSVLGNQALLDGLIGQAVGCRFFRSNNVPSALASA